MSSCGRRGAGTRRRHRPKANRYNPGAPDWSAVHLPWWMGGGLKPSKAPRR